MSEIVLLYNDRQREVVRYVWHALNVSHPELKPWFAPESINMWGDIFAQILGAVERADGVVLFVGAEGLGRFQDHVEMPAVYVERWKRGRQFGCLVVQLSPDPNVPRGFGAFPTVYHDPAQTPETIAAAIAKAAERTEDPA
jgi:hypothetical protein